MECKAIARHIRIAPRKARMVVDLVRGKSVVQAQEILQFSTRDAAEPVLKCLNAAVASAAHEHGLRATDLVIAEAFVDEGPTMKRFRPRAKGRASRIRKRTCHITVVVATKEA